MTSKEAIKIIESNYEMTESLLEATKALKKIGEIIQILDDTDFDNAESLNDEGEDKGYYESICAISLVVDNKARW